jgi:hypothetical protein
MGNNALSSRCRQLLLHADNIATETTSASGPHTALIVLFVVMLSGNPRAGVR